ncbi:MAG: transcriptional regulator, LysR family, partial [Pseudomonas sp.]|nr:transcriptional regulator, LysR family [Pseudomonas sp.]
MLDLNDIALFVQVVRSGSFAEAARRLGLPPNTVSRRVQQLEAHLGTRLLQRSTRKLTLTSSGQSFHERCAGSVDGLLEAGQELMTGSGEPSGRVRVAAPADFFEFFLMRRQGQALRPVRSGRPDHPACARGAAGRGAPVGVLAVLARAGGRDPAGP